MTNYRFRNLIIMIVLLTIIDALLTTLGIVQGFQEANPIMNFLINYIGILWTVFLMIIIITLILWFVIDNFSDEQYHVYLAGIVGWKLCVVLTWLGILLKL